MIGGDAVTPNGEHASIVNIRERRRRLRHVFKIRRQLDVGRLWIPLVKIPFGNFHRLPVRVALKNFAVLLEVHGGSNRSAHRRFDFLRRGPDIAQKNGFAVRSLSKRFGSQVEIHTAGKRVSHHQRRRRQIVGAHQRMNATLKIAIAAEHRDRHKIVVLDRSADRLRKRTAVANARRAAVTDKVELQSLSRNTLRPEAAR